MTRRLVEIESLQAFDRHIARARRLNGWFVQSLDLTDRTDVLLRVDPRGAVFLGCLFATSAEDHLRRSGALLFPRLPDLPFDPYRADLYDATELYGTDSYPESRDAAIYAWSKAGSTRGLTEDLARTLHDHAITDALNDAPPDRASPGGGIMGGHALLRGEEAYRAVAELPVADALAARWSPAVARAQWRPPTSVPTCVPGRTPWTRRCRARAGAVLPPQHRYWVGTAFQVRDAGQSPVRSQLQHPYLALRTRTDQRLRHRIAKYFANALREDTLLHRCRGGIVYLPGEAGTVQEIFQAVTENYYVAEPGQVAPMILVGVDYWTRELPAWPLLQRLGQHRGMGQAIHCVDEVAEAAALLA